MASPVYVTEGVLVALIVASCGTVIGGGMVWVRGRRRRLAAAEVIDVALPPPVSLALLGVFTGMLLVGSLIYALTVAGLWGWSPDVGATWLALGVPLPVLLTLAVGTRVADRWSPGRVRVDAEGVAITGDRRWALRWDEPYDVSVFETRHPSAEQCFIVWTVVRGDQTSVFFHAAGPFELDPNRAAWRDDRPLGLDLGDAGREVLRRMQARDGAIVGSRG